MAGDARAAVDLVGVLRVSQQISLIDGRRMPRRDVTTLTQERRFAHQHPIVVRPVRVVAGHAALGDRGVLPQVGSTLLGVTTGAALVDGGACLQESDVRASVNVMTGRARQGTFPQWHVVEAVLLVGDVLVTAAAQRLLVLRLDLRRAFRGMHTVAADAADVALVMLAAGPERMRAS